MLPQVLESSDSPGHAVAVPAVATESAAATGDALAAWLAGIEEVPAAEDTPLLKKVQAFRVHEAPLHV